MAKAKGTTPLGTPPSAISITAAVKVAAVKSAS
jgi:hypothetical protein